MSIHLPPHGPISGEPLPEPSPSKKRKRREEATEEVVQKSLPREEHVPEKKRKREVEKLESHEVESDVGEVSERILHRRQPEEGEEEAPPSRKRKAEEAPVARKRQKTGLSSREALIHDLSQKKESTDPETIINCLNTIRDNKLLKDGDPAVTAIAQSLIEALFKASATSELSLEQKIKIFSFIHENSLHLEESAWRASITLITPDSDWIQSAILDIPEEERAAVIRDSLPLFDDEMDSFERGDCVEEVHKLPQDERAAIIQDAVRFFTNDLSWREKKEILEMMRDIPQAERASLIHDSSFFIDRLEWRKMRDFLNHMRTISPPEREALMQDTRPLLNSITDIDGQLHILMTMLPLPQAERRSLIQDATPFLSTTSLASEYNVAIFELMRQIPQAERAALVQVIIPLLSSITDKHYVVYMLYAMLQIPQAERVTLVQDMTPLLTKIGSAYEMATLLVRGHKIPHEERRALIQNATPLLIAVGAEKVSLLEKLYTIPQTEDRATLFQDIQDSLSLLSGRMTFDDIMNIIEALREIPQAERRTLIQDTSTLVWDNMDGGERVAILKAMHQVPQEERRSLIQDIKILLPATLSPATMSGRSTASLLEEMSKIPHTERKNVVQHSLPLLSDHMDMEDKTYILKAMRNIPHAERATCIQDSAPLFDDAMDGYTKAHFLETIHCLPKEKRSSFVQEAKPILPTLLQVARKEPLLIFYLLPNALKTEERLSRISDLLRDPEYQAAIVSSLERELSDEKAPPELLMKLADFVTQFTSRLRLHDEHPVMQQAIEIVSAGAIIGEKNPFSLHKKLQTLVKEPIDFKPPESDVAGTKTAFRLNELQTSGKAFEVARKELPHDATDTAWKQIVDGLKDKVETNDAARRQLEEYGTTWTELWIGCLADTYLSGLLKLSGERVSIVEAQFRAILHHLLAQEKSVNPGKIFSEQEELLIKQAMSIQHCSGGKKEGIALTYKLLDPTYKYRAKGLEGGDPEEIRAKEFLADTLQKALSDQFSGTNALMQELTGAQEVGQASHQAIYLKNLIGPLVGLRHDVIFDKYTGVLDDILVAKPREEVLQAFFRHFTPQNLVKELMRVVNNDFRTNSKIIRHLVEEGMEEGWDWDKDTFVPIRLNERGALQILQKVGYLT